MASCMIYRASSKAAVGWNWSTDLKSLCSRQNQTYSMYVYLNWRNWGNWRPNIMSWNLLTLRTTKMLVQVCRHDCIANLKYKNVNCDVQKVWSLFVLYAWYLQSSQWPYVPRMLVWGPRVCNLFSTDKLHVPVSGRCYQRADIFPATRAKQNFNNGGLHWSFSSSVLLLWINPSFDVLDHVGWSW